MAGLFRRYHPNCSQQALALRIRKRLTATGINYHLRTLQRQLCGTVSKVPLAVEKVMRQLVLECKGWSSEAEIERELAALGISVPARERRPSHTPIETVVPLAHLWLYLNLGETNHSLASQIQQQLARRNVTRSLVYLQRILAGHEQGLTRREVREALLDLLAGHGIRSERAAQAALKEHALEVHRSIRARKFSSAIELYRLTSVWRLRHHDYSSSRLATSLRRVLAERGISLSLDHIRLLVSEHTKLVRQGVLEAMEALLQEEFPEVEDWTAEAAKLSPQRLEDLSWVQAEPIAALARQWVGLNPGKSMRKLAIQVSKTVAQMGYLRNPGSIQSVLGGHKKTTRGFVYRAVLRQLGTPKRNLAIPAEHFVGTRAHLPVCDAAVTSEETQEARTQHRDWRPTLEEYLEEANDYLPRARSPHFLPFVAYRAQRLYGIPRRLAKASIVGKADRPRQGLGSSDTAVDSLIDPLQRMARGTRA